VRNGKVVFTVSGLKVGVHDIEVFYSGNDRYLPAGTEGKIKVHPANETIHAHEVSEDHVESQLEMHATGNPIFLLLMMILVICGIGLKRFKR
jgi:hypothetical protein